MKKLDYFHRRVYGIRQICLPNSSQGMIWWAYQSPAAIINKQHNVDTRVGQLAHYGRRRGPHPFTSTPFSFPCGLSCALLYRIKESLHSCFAAARIECHELGGFNNGHLFQSQLQVQSQGGTGLGPPQGDELERTRCDCVLALDGLPTS